MTSQASEGGSWAGPAWSCSKGKPLSRGGRFKARAPSCGRRHPRLPGRGGWAALSPKAAGGLLELPQASTSLSGHYWARGLLGSKWQAQGRPLLILHGPSQVGPPNAPPRSCSQEPGGTCWGEEAPPHPPLAGPPPGHHVCRSPQHLLHEDEPSECGTAAVGTTTVSTRAVHAGLQGCPRLRTAPMSTRVHTHTCSCSCTQALWAAPGHEPPRTRDPARRHTGANPCPLLHVSGGSGCFPSRLSFH